MTSKKESKKCIKKVRGPTGDIPYYLSKFLEIVEEDSYIVGEKLNIQGLEKELKHLKVVSVEVLALPEDEREVDDLYMTAKLKFEIRCDKNKYNVTSSKGKKELEKDVKQLLYVEEENNPGANRMRAFDIVYTGEDHYLTHVIILENDYDFMCMADKIVVTESPFYDLVWNKFMNRIITEGVCYSHGEVPVKLRNSLRDNFNELASKTSVDYHPNSNDIVRDLVHPALYPYVKGESKIQKGFTEPNFEDEKMKSDFWGRPYEKSTFQWLPTPFKITSDGHCTIEEYINNLDRNKFSILYANLERLFEIFLPYFEEVWNYINSIKFYHGELDESDEESDTENYVDDDINQDDDDEIGKSDNNDDVEDVNDDGSESVVKKLKKFNVNKRIPETKKFKDTVNRKQNLLHDRELQVIVKIVDYTLQPGQAYEGVWHAEGMSHENIVMTGIYFLDRDLDLEGGDLKFKRAFTKKERNSVHMSVPQSRPIVFNEFANEGFVPLGHFPTEEGYMLVFPNCHIHKIGKLINKASNKSSSRRIIVFFVVNPDRKIISTREIAPQQDITSLAQAKQYRLELMAERKYNKEKLNVRDIELCEH